MRQRAIWPKDKKSAAIITVNLEAQYFAKLYYPDDNIDLTRGEISTLAKEGINFGLPKILDLLDEFDVKATFFILAATAEEYPNQIKEIARRGHEIACHGYYHENLALLTAEEQQRILSAAKTKIETISGENVVGFRMPEGEITEETMNLVKRLGFNYSSSLSDDDIPYIREESGLVEIPIHWELYDLPYFAYTFEPMIPQSQDRACNPNIVLENWIIELEASKKYGTLFNLQLDPQATGEQGRIFMLRKILEKVLDDNGIWLTTGRMLAEYCCSQK